MARCVGADMSETYSEPEEEKTLDEEDVDFGVIETLTPLQRWFHHR